MYQINIFSPPLPITIRQTKRLSLLNTSRKKVWTRIWNFIWNCWWLEHLVTPIVVAIVVLYIGASILNPPSLPDIHHEYIYSTMPPTQKVETLFKLDLQDDNRPWIIITAFNKGNSNDDQIKGISCNFYNCLI
jgi:hypothetical protein